MTRSRRKVFWNRCCSIRGGVPGPYARGKPFTRGCRSWTGCQGTTVKMRSEIWWPGSPSVSPSFLNRWRTRTSPVYLRRYIIETLIAHIMTYGDLRKNRTDITLIWCTRIWPNILLRSTKIQSEKKKQNWIFREKNIWRFFFFVN